MFIVNNNKVINFFEIKLGVQSLADHLIAIRKKITKKIA